MRLEDYTRYLEALDPGLIMPEGFSAPRSYRGYPNSLTFVAATYVTVASMLEHARTAVLQTYEGHDGKYMVTPGTVILISTGAYDESLDFGSLDRMVAAALVRRSMLASASYIR